MASNGSIDQVAVQLASAFNTVLPPIPKLRNKLFLSGWTDLLNSK
jgi:hypothetical protein